MWSDLVSRFAAQQTGIDHVVSSKDSFYNNIEVSDLAATVKDDDTAGVQISRTAVPGVSGCTDGEGSATCLLFEPAKQAVTQPQVPGASHFAPRYFLLPMFTNLYVKFTQNCVLRMLLKGFC